MEENRRNHTYFLISFFNDVYKLLFCPMENDVETDLKNSKTFHRNLLRHFFRESASYVRSRFVRNEHMGNVEGCWGFFNTHPSIGSQ